MRRNLLTVFILSIATSMVAQWKPVGNYIRTSWSEKVSPENVLPEYPRPQMERNEWQNLNGLWDYAIRPELNAEPTNYDGKILVPFAIESSLSGVGKTVGDTNELWYKRNFTVPDKWRSKHILLHFGAVDWRTTIFINDIQVGTHEGGYTPFFFDITPYLEKGRQQKLVVRVWDPTNHNYQPCGKQSVVQSRIRYTPVTGIWQTVWMEPVAEAHIYNVRSLSNIDRNEMSLTIGVEKANNQNMAIEAKLLDGGSVVANAKGLPNERMLFTIKNPKLWSPDSPFLYDLQISLLKDGRVIDKVRSYTAFRKISAKRDDHGIMRMQLNNQNLFQFGPLDQGWWPDGLYTAPTDEALKFDIIKTKQWGFNMIRKHVKVEPERWYYYCDKEGILVWQDMPSGDKGDYWTRDDRRMPANHWEPYAYEGGTDRLRDSISKENYYKEWKDIMDFGYSHPCIVVWVPFNEAWGQFDTEKVAAWTKAQDPSRLVDPASGGNFYHCGDMMDMHHYPNPKRFYLYDPERVDVLGEFGGIGFPIKDHTWWNDSKNWGYVQFKDLKEVTAEYVKYANELIKLAQQGYSAGVYTQTTDVEGEINGLMTYDRKVMKMDEDELTRINQAVINSIK